MLLMGPDLFHTDGRTDITMLIVAFRNFAKAPKNLDSVAIFGSYLAIFGLQNNNNNNNNNNSENIN